jgi:hypothetical protein
MSNGYTGCFNIAFHNFEDMLYDYTSSFPFPFVLLQRRGCLVAPLFL